MRLVLTIFAALLCIGSAIAQSDTVLKEIPVDLVSPSAKVEALGPLPAAQKLFSEGNYVEAATAFKKLAALGPNPSATAGLVRSLVAMRDMSVASEVVKKGLADFADSPAIHEAYGEYLFRRGELWTAEAEFAKTINTWGPNAQAYLWLSRIYTASSYHKKSRTMLERAHQLDPDDPDIAEAYRRAKPSKAVQLALNEEGKGDSAALADLVRLISHHQRECTVVGEPRNIETPLAALLHDAQHLRGFGLDVNLDGQRGRLLLDTGASGILISRRLAEKAGVKRLASSMIHGIGDKGGTASYMGHVDSVKIGDLELRDCIVEVSDSRSVLDDDGLIGTDLFQDFLVHLDFSHGKFKLSPLPGPPAKKAEVVDGKSEKKDAGNEEAELTDPYKGPEVQNFTRMYRVGHYLLIPTRLNETMPKLFLLDTGAFNNMMSPEAAREVTKVHGDEYMQIKGLSGSVKKVMSADKATLSFSRYKQQNQDVATFDLSAISRSAGMEISGALGFAMLRMMEIKLDYRDGLVDFFYDAKLWSR